MRGVLLASSAVSLALSCGDESLRTRVSGEHINIYQDKGTQLCGGSLAYMDSHVVAVSKILDLSLPEVDFLLVDADRVSDYCPPDGAACYQYDENRIISADAPQTHEVAHAILGANELVPDDFLAEGLAHVFEENLPWDEDALLGTIHDILDFKDTATNNLPSMLHGRATHFTWFLLEHYGTARVAALMRRHISGRPREEQERAILETMGETLEGVLDTYATTPECLLAEMRTAVVECGAALTPWSVSDPDEWSMVVTLGCERPDALGPASGIMWTTRALEVKGGGEYMVSALGSGLETAEVVVARCGSRCGDAFYHTLSPGESDVLSLKEGRYYTMLMRHVDDPGEIGLTITRTD